MRRRTFIAALGGAAAWPLAARAQQAVPPVARLGILVYSSPQADTLIAPFLLGMRDIGYVEGRNISIEYLCVPKTSSVLIT